MGIITKIIFFFLFFFVANTSAQTTGDTILVNTQMYIRHIVKPTETYNIISDKYKISVEELKLHNKNSKLYYQQLLFIPIKSTLAERLLFKNKKYKKSLFSSNKQVSKINNYTKKDSLNIAVLLPFYSSKNSHLFSSSSQSEQTKNDIYRDSYLALNYLEGLIIATDSLSKIGLIINLFIYDTENDSAKVDQIIKNGKLKDIDLIIGPVFSRNLRKVTGVYGENKDKKIISPLSRNSSILKDGGNIFQIIPPFDLQINKISRYISKRYKNEKILILAQKKEEIYAKNYKNYFRNKKRRTKMCLFDGLNTITRDTLAKFLSNHKYIVLIPSADRSFVSKVIPVLGTIDTNMIVFGLHNWQSYENLDVSTLMKLNVHFPDPYFFNYQEKYNKRFVALFAQKFNALPNKYAQIAFQQCMYFCANKGDYKFKKYYSKGGFVNYNFPIVKYTKYSLERIN